MKKLRNHSKSSFPYFGSLFLLGVFTTLALAGCQQSGHTSDPRLKKIDEMLDAQLPAGTSKSKVSFYLSSQGFSLEGTSDPRAIVAVVHHVDTDTLQPATARVTFHFDASGNLESYELAAVEGSGSQP
jgi:hypothetical protein